MKKILSQHDYIQRKTLKILSTCSNSNWRKARNVLRSIQNAHQLNELANSISANTKFLHSNSSNVHLLTLQKERLDLKNKII